MTKMKILVRYLGHHHLSISSKKGNEIFENLNQVRNSIKDLIDLNQSLLEENAKLKKNKSYKKY